MNLPGVTKCRSCHADIRWALTTKRKPIPLDAASSRAGNLVLREFFDDLGDGRFEARAVEPLLDGPEVVRWVSHFATCPHAAEHRKVADRG